MLSAALMMGQRGINWFSLEAGEYVEEAGGYFTEVMYTQAGGGGDRYALITAPFAEGHSHSSGTWQNAMNYVAGLTIGDHNDWRLPTRDECRVAYRKFKPGTNINDASYGATDKVEPPLGNYTSSNPSRTSLTPWRAGNAEAFYEVGYWTADESGSRAFIVDFNSGNEQLLTKTTTRYVRAVRRHYF